MDELLIFQVLGLNLRRKKTYNYSISKHCLEFISKEIRDLASKNILTNNLRVGVTKTNT